MTTTYGTIPTSSNPSTTKNQEFVSQIRSGLQKRRPWNELLSIQSISFPTSFNDALFKISTNISYFRTNYTIILLLILFLSLLWHPISLIVFIIMMAAWLFLYFLRDEDRPLMVAGTLIDDRIVLFGLAIVTLVFLFMTDVTANIVAAIVIGVVVVLVHAVLRGTDDLSVGAADVIDEEVGRPKLSRGGGGGRKGERMPLKETASASFSSSS